ncbi:hypothetical protein [Bacillus cereus]|nr:hypothetical protein [Bacillus cereus]KZD35355.1 hypothetical protein B4081_2085 [Bacillus cereus]
MEKKLRYIQFQKGILVSVSKDALRFLFPISYSTKLPFQANFFSFKQFIH